jgi:hypothetical protein
LSDNPVASPKSATDVDTFVLYIQEQSRDISELNLALKQLHEEYFILIQFRTKVMRLASRTTAIAYQAL